MPELAFVLEKDGQILGNIMYTKACLEEKNWIYIPSAAADCCEDIAAVETFDATVPPREKK
jgi:hypothetical protein